MKMKYEKEDFILRCKQCNVVQLSKPGEIEAKDDKEHIYLFEVPCKHCNESIPINGQRLSKTFRQDLIKDNLVRRFTK